VAQRVRLAPLDRPHLALTREWANDPQLMRLMDRRQLVSAAEHEAWFASVVQSDDCAYFAIETADGGAHVGNVWLWAIDQRHRKAEVRVVIGDAAARGKGMGAEAIDRVCRHGFDRLGLHRIYAYVLSINPAARRAFERAGFALEGTLRDDRWAEDKFVDTYLLARLREGRLKPAPTTC
jgi:RimJ/RimL family protein N-acetyltransferase